MVFWFCQPGVGGSSAVKKNKKRKKQKIWKEASNFHYCDPFANLNTKNPISSFIWDKQQQWQQQQQHRENHLKLVLWKWQVFLFLWSDTVHWRVPVHEMSLQLSNMYVFPWHIDVSTALHFIWNRIAFVFSQQTYTNRDIRQLCVCVHGSMATMLAVCKCEYTRDSISVELYSSSKCLN